jgi:hypothetical protein
VFLALQNPEPLIVTIIREPAHSTTLADVLIGSIGLTGALVLAAVVAGSVMAFVLVQWHRRHPPEAGRLPSISPLIPDSNPSRSSQSQSTS